MMLEKVEMKNADEKRLTKKLSSGKAENL